MTSDKSFIYYEQLEHETRNKVNKTEQDIRNIESWDEMREEERIPLWGRIALGMIFIPYIIGTIMVIIKLI